MKHRITRDLYEYENQLWKVNGRGSGLRTDILRALLKQLLTLTRNHRKLFAYMFILRVNSQQVNNSNLTLFFKTLSREVKKHYGIQQHYFWVREKKQSEFPHYHVVVYLDGSQVCQPYLLQQWLASLWSNNGTISWVKYYNLHRTNIASRISSDIDEAKRRIFYHMKSIAENLKNFTHHLSYFAKYRDKGHRASQVKDFGHSRGF